MLPASNRGAGMNIGFPDVCLVPAAPAPIPTPFPNLAMNAMAAPFAVTVWISMMNALNMISSIPMTSGDEGGSASPIKGPGRYTMGNPLVYVELMPAINLLCPTTGNNMVNPLGAVLVPSAVNVFFTLRADEAGPGADVSDAAVAALGAAVTACDGVRGARLLDGGVGVVEIRTFVRDLSTLLHNELRRLEAGGMRALVLDLRGCPGGDLDAALALADDFLDRGALLATRLDPDGDEVPIHARQGDPYAFPLAIVVDGGTASAAELFAGCMQAHGRAVVVGERTYGKGSTQRLVPGFSSPGARYETVATFVLPGGAPIEGRGVSPDVEAPAARALDAAFEAMTEDLQQEVR
jgi:carboxyl-terminal processing protease